MQSAHSSDASSSEPEISSGLAQAMHPLSSDFKITTEDKSILMGYADEFERADTQMRRNILEKAMGKLYNLRPGNSAFDKKEAKEACI